MVALIYLACAAYIASVFYRRAKKVKDGTNTKGKAIGIFFGYAIAPVILYGMMFFALMGVEELANTAIIGEVYARSLFFVVSGGLAVVLLSTLVFCIVIFAMRKTEEIKRED